MDLTSNRVNNLSQSETIAMATKARELKAEGKDIISLSIGEPDFDTPSHIKDAAKAALDEGFTKYTPVPGFLELREAISKKFKRDNGLDYSPTQIVVSTGAKHTLANVMMSIINPGDEVIIFTPYWVSYKELVKLGEGKAVFVEGKIENNFKIDPADLEAAITDKTRAILYSSPSNPTGVVYSKEDLKAIADVVVKHPQIMVISDEIYEYINFEGKHESIAQFDYIKDQVVTVNGFAKGFAMTGWRIGYMGAPEWLAKACNKLQGQFTSGTNAIAQRACIAALEGDMSESFKMRDTYKERRDLVLSKLNEIPGIGTYTPTGAFYIFPDVSEYFGKSYDNQTIADASDFAMFLLNDANVATVAGSAFGAPNCIRISFAASNEELIEAMSRIKNSLSKLS